MDSADRSVTSLAHAALAPSTTTANASKRESFILNVEDDVFLVPLIYETENWRALCRSEESSH